MKNSENLKDTDTQNNFNDLQLPPTGLFCGDWGAPRCTGERLFNYLGNKEVNVYTPINIQYHYVKSTEEAPGNIIPLNETAQPCNTDFEVSEAAVRGRGLYVGERKIQTRMAYFTRITMHFVHCEVFLPHSYPFLHMSLWTL